jgi:hypothetical protein
MQHTQLHPIALFTLILLITLTHADPFLPGVDHESFTPTRTIPVATLDELTEALDNARPGDLIEVADGDYETTEPITLRTSGTPDAPIILRAANRGGARITGVAGFRVESATHIVIEGFHLAHVADTFALILDESRHIRFTRNRITLQERPETQETAQHTHWILITGHGSGYDRISTLCPRRLLRRSPFSFPASIFREMTSSWSSRAMNPGSSSSARFSAVFVAMVTAKDYTV